ncbi:MAG: FkbM family methyltransferase [Cyanobacteriota bacterium]
MLSFIHLSFLFTLIGQRQQALECAWRSWLELEALGCLPETWPGLLYLPRLKPDLEDRRAEIFSRFFSAGSSRERETWLVLITEALCFSSMVFYNAVGLRWLEFTAHARPNYALGQLKLGLALLTNQRPEGLVNLQRAHELAPNQPQVLQALYLAYRDLGLRERAESAQDSAVALGLESSWSAWAGLSGDSFFTYLPFERTLSLAVEASLRSFVTSVLLAEGDWFEAEMEFWRSWLQPGMTVIDVGANVGVYTFSAAQRVGSTGRVLAVEPFSTCVACLRETKRVNALDWVAVCPGAASDRQGKIYLSLHGANELNEVSSERPTSGAVEEVACFTLDSLFEREALEGVDVIKIDAEGHELAVLGGCREILDRFSPIILYENIAGSHGSNQPVAQYLLDLGYQLLVYGPFVQALVPVDNLEKIGGNLNVIARRGTSSM